MLRPLFLSAVLAGLLGVTNPVFASAKGGTRTHVVYSGQRLGSIAKRYNVSIEAICYANDLDRREPIKPGQRLVIPERSDKDGSVARAKLMATQRRVVPASKATVPAGAERAPGRRTTGPGWKQYTRAPRRKGYLEIVTHNNKWRGLVVDAKGRIRPIARQSIARLLGATGDHPGVPDRLIRLMVDVSDTFGGRGLYVVSGYRTTSYFQDSRHKTSQAVDFNVMGVPNAMVRDYLLTRTNVGVGFYPNSSFLHLDVRPKNTYWVDYAGPGEAPRRKPRGHSPTPVHFDDEAEEAAESRTAKGGSLPAYPPLADGATIPAALPERGAANEESSTARTNALVDQLRALVPATGGGETKGASAVAASRTAPATGVAASKTAPAVAASKTAPATNPRP